MRRSELRVGPSCRLRGRAARRARSTSARGRPRWPGARRRGRSGRRRMVQPRRRGLPQVIGTGPAWCATPRPRETARRDIGRTGGGARVRPAGGPASPAARRVVRRERGRCETRAKRESSRRGRRPEAGPRRGSCRRRRGRTHPTSRFRSRRGRLRGIASPGLGPRHRVAAKTLPSPGAASDPSRRVRAVPAVSRSPAG